MADRKLPEVSGAGRELRRGASRQSDIHALQCSVASSRGYLCRDAARYVSQRQRRSNLASTPVPALNHDYSRTQLLADHGDDAGSRRRARCPKSWMSLSSVPGLPGFPRREPLPGAAPRWPCWRPKLSAGAPVPATAAWSLPGLKLGVNKLISMYGRERTQRMYAASLASIDCVEQIVREEKIDCDFSRCGHLEVACKQKHFDDYARQVEIIAREFNHQLRVVQRMNWSPRSDRPFTSAAWWMKSAPAESGTVRSRTGTRRDESGRLDLRATRASRRSSAKSRKARPGWRAHHLARHSLGARSVRRNQRLHRSGDSLAAEENHSDRLVHHYDGSLAAKLWRGN